VAWLTPQPDPEAKREFIVQEHVWATDQWTGNRYLKYRKGTALTLEEAKELALPGAEGGKRCSRAPSSKNQ
jgi:hypothetical protein